jgi:hypothetical protein
VVVALVGIAIAIIMIAIVNLIAAAVLLAEVVKLAQVVVHVQGNLAILALINLAVRAVTGEAGVHGLM